MKIGGAAHVYLISTLEGAPSKISMGGAFLRRPYQPQAPDAPSFAYLAKGGSDAAGSTDLDPCGNLGGLQKKLNFELARKGPSSTRAAKSLKMGPRLEPEVSSSLERRVFQHLLTTTHSLFLDPLPNTYFPQPHTVTSALVPAIELA